MTPLCLLNVPDLVHYVYICSFSWSYFYRLFLSSSHKNNFISKSSGKLRIFFTPQHQKGGSAHSWDWSYRSQALKTFISKPFCKLLKGKPHREHRPASMPKFELRLPALAAFPSWLWPGEKLHCKTNGQKVFVVVILPLRLVQQKLWACFDLTCTFAAWDNDKTDID